MLELKPLAHARIVVCALREAYSVCMELTITPELEQMIRRKLDSGEYDTPQQVIENALHRLNQDESDFLGWSTAELQAAIDEGWEEAERGELMTGDEARARLAEMRAARRCA